MDGVGCLGLWSASPCVRFAGPPLNLPLDGMFAQPLLCGRLDADRSLECRFRLFPAGRLRACLPAAASEKRRARPLRAYARAVT